MDKNQAKTIIKDTFENKFDKLKFKRFIVNLLNIKTSMITDQGVQFNINQIPNIYHPFIDSFEKIAEYKSEKDKIDILSIKLKKETSIERARTMQRNFIAWYLRGSCDGENRDAALAAFISPANNDWRFSLIKMDYSLGEDKKGRIKISEKLTPAKRWSFLVGANEKSHTAQSQLIDIVAIDDKGITLDQLEEAFDVEKVTKEFFGKYRELFLKIKEALDKILLKDDRVKSDFESKNINTVDFSKKLLGQIVFLYFLQKKGWFGVARDADWGTGPKNFLRDLFEGKHGKYKNFYNDILEPLFYEALRNDRSYDDDYYRLFNCKIPFLNGGLFDPINNYDWVHTDINLPNELFSNSDLAEEGDKGTGILDIFDRYNFTVKEDEPLEKEVAVDPEMLGKVFENLLEVKDRKSKGTYYTPREIVHYMCQQSLINYLATELEGKVSQDDVELLFKYGEQFGENNTELVDNLDENGIPESIIKNADLIDNKLLYIKVCDPAVGSGAFLVGIMTEIVRIRNILSNYINDSDRTIYNFKRECIENSLYGVDIDPGAVEIAKLRLWLSLVVDEEDIKKIKPLPNLDYKIIQGNSLIEILSGEFLSVSQSNIRAGLVYELKKYKEELFNITSPSKKEKQRQKIDVLIRKIFEYDRNLIINKMNQKINIIQNQSRLFRDSKFESDDKRRIIKLKDKIDEIKKIKVLGPLEHFEWHIVFSEVFNDKGGYDVIIGNPPYDVYEGHRRGEIDEIKKYPIYEKSTGGKLNSYKLFLAKSVELQKKEGILCEIFQNSFLADNSALKIREYFLKKQKVLRIDSFPERDNVHLRVFEKVKMSVCILISQNRLVDKYSFLLRIWEDKYMSSGNQITLSNLGIFEIDSDKAIIPSIDQREFGILQKVSKFTRLKFYAKCYEGEINLTFHKKFLRKKKNDYAKMIKGAAVQKWFLKEKMSQGDIEYLDYKNYLKDNTANKSQHFRLKRIVMQGITGVDEKCRLKMTIINPGIFCGNSVNYILIKNKDLSECFLIALLNSKLLNWFFKVFSTNSNVNGYEIDNLPIPKISLLEQKVFTDLVNKIFVIANTNDYSENIFKQDKVHMYEEQIDKLVYNLYGLTKEEIGIVENTNI